MLPRTARSALSAVSRRARAAQSKSTSSKTSVTSALSGLAAKLQQKFEISKTVPASNFLSGLSTEQRSVSESEMKSDNKSSKSGTMMASIATLAGIDLIGWWLVALLGDDGV